MRIIYLYIIIFFLFVGCSPSPENKTEKKSHTNRFESSAKYSSDSLNLKKEGNIETPLAIEKRIMISSSQISPYKDIVINNNTFKLVTNSDGDTTHLTTNDHNFITPEGYKIGTLWQDIPQNLKDKLITMRGWGHYIILDSKWILAFGIGTSYTDSLPTYGSTVGWIFKK